MLELARVRDSRRLVVLPPPDVDLLDGLYDVHALEDAAEDDVAPVEPGRLHRRERAVRASAFAGLTTPAPVSISKFSSANFSPFIDSPRAVARVKSVMRGDRRISLPGRGDDVACARRRHRRETLRRGPPWTCVRDDAVELGALVVERLAGFTDTLLARA